MICIEFVLYVMTFVTKYLSFTCRLSTILLKDIVIYIKENLYVLNGDDVLVQQWWMVDVEDCYTPVVLFKLFCHKFCSMRVSLNIDIMTFHL